MANNWFIVLGIEFDPIPTDWQKIEAKIKEKEVEWRSDERNRSGAKKRYAQMQLGNTGLMRKELMDQRKREQIARDARKIVYNAVDEAARKAANRNREIPKNRLEGIEEYVNGKIKDDVYVDKVRLPPQFVRKRLLEQGYTLVDGQEEKNDQEDRDAARDAYRRFCEERSVNASDYATYERDLKLFEAKDLYEFAFPRAKDAKRRASLPWSDLDDAARSRKDSITGHGAEKTSAERLYTGVQLLEDADKRADYDRYLGWKKIDDALSAAKRDANLLTDGVVRAYSAETAISNITEVTKDRTESKMILQGFCSEQDPELVIEHSDQDSKRENEENERPHISLENASIEGVKDFYPFEGKEVKPQPRVGLNGNTLTYGIDYDLIYRDNAAIGDAMVFVVGRGIYTGSIGKSFALRYSIQEAHVSLSQASYRYDGATHCPMVVVWYRDRTLIEGRDYQVTYQRNRDVGSAQATVHGVGEFFGSVYQKFIITKGESQSGHQPNPVSVPPVEPSKSGRKPTGSLWTWRIIGFWFPLFTQIGLGIFKVGSEERNKERMRGSIQGSLAWVAVFVLYALVECVAEVW